MDTDIEKSLRIIGDQIDYHCKMVYVLKGRLERGLDAEGARRTEKQIDAHERVREDLIFVENTLKGV